MNQKGCMGCLLPFIMFLIMLTALLFNHILTKDNIVAEEAVIEETEEPAINEAPMEEVPSIEETEPVVEQEPVIEEEPETVAQTETETEDPLTEIEQQTEPAVESVYYENCGAVREAGADPIRTGDPGYGTHLDRDGDGVGCEQS
ncbi:excalibur calcium-binding domain-containing protein [Domibacillus antri]|uniref:excalibur calcium-binding domain-containing protein n=1 Tax=Domibacillus antri TaxID=1714264 RepID=UPI000AA7ECF6|nr:excalibur calcium-binding domain-containing protein [Domibacillus antri]